MLGTHQAVVALGRFLREGVQRRLDAVRLARAACALLNAGVSPASPFLAGILARCVASHQRHDGGWRDVEETAWCVGYLVALGDSQARQRDRAEMWLRSQQLGSGGWGRTARDRARLPIVGLIAAMAPDLVDARTVQWAIEEWQRDLEGPAQLTYKAGFFLLTQSLPKMPTDVTLVGRTIAYLVEQQETDGGFGPWKGHPTGSDPWSTGAVLWGLSRFAERVPPRLFELGADWLVREQLPDGHWPYHYLDEGTSMALIGASSILPFLRK